MNIYGGLFLVAFSGLSLEITLVRLLSVTTGYHLVFFAISTAMLGMTAGATRVFLSPEAFRSENPPKVLVTFVHLPGNLGEFLPGGRLLRRCADRSSRLEA
jgi:hypothetical protein